MRTRQLVIFLLGLGDTRVSESAAEGSGGGLLGSDGRSHGCLVAGTFTLGGTGNSEWAWAQLQQGKRPEGPEEARPSGVREANVRSLLLGCLIKGHELQERTVSVQGTEVPSYSLQNQLLQGLLRKTSPFKEKQEGRKSSRLALSSSSPGEATAASLGMLPSPTRSLLSPHIYLKLRQTTKVSQLASSLGIPRGQARVHLLPCTCRAEAQGCSNLLGCIPSLPIHQFAKCHN